jgi:hypothetical protein
MKLFGILLMLVTAIVFTAPDAHALRLKGPGKGKIGQKLKAGHQKRVGVVRKVAGYHPVALGAKAIKKGINKRRAKKQMPLQPVQAISNDALE